jgi:hypothetical protein
MTSLILPSADTEMMNLFLEHMSSTYARYFVVMQVDQASWHLTKDLRIPENIRLIAQPAYSPELNPKAKRQPLLVFWNGKHHLKEARLRARRSIAKSQSRPNRKMLLSRRSTRSQRWRCDLAPDLWKRESFGYTLSEGGQESCKRFKKRTHLSSSAKRFAWHRPVGSRLRTSPVSWASAIPRFINGVRS